MIIAIDGPAGSGKTTVSKILAKRLKFYSLDTGATYRALTLVALRKKCNLDDIVSLSNLAKSLSIRLEGEKIYLDNEDITEEIRKPIIDRNISKIVSYPEVREVMVGLQRDMAKDKNLVVEGRDITTVVFPNAEFKFYLDADFDIRVERRFKEFLKKKINITLKEVREDLKKRDEADKNRKFGALKLAEDSVYIDTTDLTIEEVVDKIISYIDARANI